MPSHKILKSITHNFSHSLISLMNYINDDYFLGHLLKQARKTKLNRINIDIINNIVEPKDLLTSSIIESIENWNKWFPALVEDSGSSLEYINSAKVTIEFDLNKERPYPHDLRIIENPFVCEILIIDDRGKEYKRKHEGWWFPEA